MGDNILNTQNFNIMYYYLYYSFLKFKSKVELEEYQNKKVIKHLKYIMQKSDYYSKYLESFEIAGWRKFPIITKKEWMENFDTINTVGLEKNHSFKVAMEEEMNRNFSNKVNNITIGLSSGTSGNRGLFLVSDKERCKWAGYILSKVFPELITSSKKIKIAFFLRANSNLYETVNSGKIKLEYFDLLYDMDENLKNLNDYSPDVLIAPTSVLKYICRNKLDGKLNELNPEKIISVAEVLEDIDATLIKSTFSVPIVHQIYQCTEGLLAYTCASGNIHLAEENLIIEEEYISKDKFSPIITDFNRISQPIIKYKLNDILTKKEGICSCGNVATLISRIEGRLDDVFILKNKNSLELVNIYPDFISRAIMFSSEHILDYKVVQNSSGQITVFVDYNNTEFNMLKTLIINQISEMLNKLNANVPPIDVVKGVPKQQKGVKFKRVERLQ
jgi:putative adenylate-forming enzyme